MTAGQKALLCVGPAYPFKRYGKNGVELSEMIPNIGSIVDDIAIVRSMFTEPINHDPAVTFFGTMVRGFCCSATARFFSGGAGLRACS